MFTIERLEDRLLMAAQVTQSGSTLTITGDGSDDVIRIDGAGGPGDVEVFADMDGDGDMESLGVYAGVKNITVNTKGGDDALAFVGVGLSGNVTVNTAGGNDTIALFDSLIAGHVTFNTGGGTDIIGVGSLKVGNSLGELTINTGGGNDIVSLYATDFYGDVSVSTGGGTDLLGISEIGTNFNAGVSLNGGGGIDYLAGEVVTNLQQDLSQAGASVNGLEVQLNKDAVPSSLTGPLGTQAVDALQKLQLF